MGSFCYLVVLEVIGVYICVMHHLIRQVTFFHSLNLIQQEMSKFSPGQFIMSCVQVLLNISLGVYVLLWLLCGTSFVPF